MKTRARSARLKLVALIDITFNECQDGYAIERFHEFHNVLRDEFHPLLQSRRSDKGAWSNPELNELWAGAVKTEDAEHIPLDPDIMTRLIIKLLKAAGGKTTQTIEEGPPGFSSTDTLIYAKYPAKVFDDAISKLRLLLKRKKRQSPSRKDSHAHMV
jgi:hypothetical protein